MTSLAQNNYSGMMQAILDEENPAELDAEQLSLYMQAAEMLNETQPFVSGDGRPATDGEIAETVLQALQMTGGDKSQFASALGVGDYGDEAAVQAEIDALQGPDAIADYMNKHMAYATPGREALLDVLMQIMNADGENVGGEADVGGAGERPLPVPLNRYKAQNAK